MKVKINSVDPVQDKSIEEPTRTICEICNDEKGKISGEYCRDNPKSKDYLEDMFEGTDYLDCWVYIRANETKEEYDARMVKRFSKVAS
mgnify:CR=1 FL=1